MASCTGLGSEWPPFVFKSLRFLLLMSQAKTLKVGAVRLEAACLICTILWKSLNQGCVRVSDLSLLIRKE
jgi:hypothetical protein